MNCLNTSSLTSSWRWAGSTHTPHRRRFSAQLTCTTTMAIRSCCPKPSPSSARPNSTKPDSSRSLQTMEWTSLANAGMDLYCHGIRNFDFKQNKICFLGLVLDLFFMFVFLGIQIVFKKPALLRLCTFLEHLFSFFFTVSRDSIHIQRSRLYSRMAAMSKGTDHLMSN